MSKSQERKQPEFLNVDTERLLDSLHARDHKKSPADDLEEVEQLQGRQWQSCVAGGMMMS